MEALARAWRRREGRFGPDTDAYRLFGGAREGVPGLTVDRYGPVAIFQVYEGQCQLSVDELRQAAEWYLCHVPIESVYLKSFVPDRSGLVASPALYSPEPFAGKPVPECVVVREYGVQYTIRPYAGYSTGLFLDQRENRRFLAALGAGKQVLNGFAYTCGFSVALALQGARVTSVDVSKRYLAWGKENFHLNGCALEGHRFIAEEMLRFLARSERRGEKYDLVILDPPSFGRAGGKVFSLQKDAGLLVECAARVVRSGQYLFFSANFSGWEESTLRRILNSRLHGEFRPLPKTPVDVELGSPLSAVLFQVQE